ncbi:ferritin-like domain-containing protein [Rurimicrobium arvi]|uniref:Ferritin-like metal-binding protein YciE n=1 Tax=Rurimicrobium arvi TaxID=2049916 RepID=A0ABP8MGR7_9BACT
MKSATTAAKSKAAQNSKAGPGKRNTTGKSARATATAVMEQAGGAENTPFEKLFEDILKDTYWAEQHIVESLPAMIEAATTESLKEALEDHLHVTKKQVKRLEKVFKSIGKEAEAVKCPVMEALVKEGKKCIEETPEGSMTRDAGIIISAQKIEHYEIAAYGSLVQVALTLGHDEAAQLLDETLQEEEDTDQQLTDIAETDVNPMADGETDEDAGMEDDAEEDEDESDEN